MNDQAHGTGGSETYAVFPLNVVLFPHGLLPLPARFGSSLAVRYGTLLHVRRVASTHGRRSVCRTTAVDAPVLIRNRTR